VIRDLHARLFERLQSVIKESKTTLQDCSPHLRQCLSFVVIIRKIANQTDAPVGNVLLRIPVTEEFSEKIVFKKFEKHINRQLTLLRDIRTEF